MIKSGDIEGRLRLFRYGLIVVVIVTFLVGLFAPYSSIGRVTGAPVTSFLGTAVTYTVVVAVIAVIAYFAYRYVLERTAKS